MRVSCSSVRPLTVALGLALVLSACDTMADPAPGASASAPQASAATSTVPAQGSATTLDVGTWNLEWFGDTSNGASNEALQLENVRDIMAGVDIDLWSVQEVTSTAHFDDLVAQFPGFDGFLANDASVVNGPAYYNDFGGNEQKVGLIYRSAEVSVTAAEVILTAYDYEFAGRPPVEVQLTTTIDGTPQSLVVVLLHAKAGTASDSWSRRAAGSAALKSYLDSTWPTTDVLVLGDFNDDVDTSITSGEDSPYQNFVADAADWTFPTKALSDAGVSSTVYYPDMVDHHLASNEIVARYVAGSVQAFPADQYLANYDQTTSDHYPILSSYTVSGGGGGNVAPTASFSVSCTDLACSVDGTASSDPDGTIASYAWAFGDGATATGATASHTYAAGGSYTVTLTVTDNGGATDAASQTATATDPPTGGLSLSASGYKIKGKKYADLTWSGAASSDVDVLRDGSLLVTTSNSGAYTDEIGKRGNSSYSYQVCEAGTSTCSAVATVTF